MGGLPISTANGLVDLDINDRNVMLGEDTSAVQGGNGHGHDSVPIFKIGDLGFVAAFREPHYRTSLRAHVGWRVCGNPVVRQLNKSYRSQFMRFAKVFEV